VKPVVQGLAVGQFTLDAEMLAAQFGWTVETLHDFMRRGLVVSTVERGEGDDDGKWRLTMRCGNRRWRAIVRADGEIETQSFDHSPPPPARR